MKRAFITGIAGQDGSYLAELLLTEKYQVFGLARKSTDKRNVPDAVHVIDGDLSDPQSIKSAIQQSQPDEVYNLGGITDLKTAYENPSLTWDINFKSARTLLEETIEVNPFARFLQASSSEIFLPSEHSLSEESPRDVETQNPYARAKLAVDTELITTAKQRGIFACSALLFNHESPRRSDKAVLRKITQTLTKIKQGQHTELSLGNIFLARDWGFAGDYVLALRDMLRGNEPEDFCIATGVLQQVRDAITIAADYLNMQLTWDGEGKELCAYDMHGKKIIFIDPLLYKEMEQYPKRGNIKKAEALLHWKPKTTFTSLIQLLIEHELRNNTFS